MKPLDTHEQTVGKSLYICSIFAPIFSGVVVVLSGDVVNSIFHITVIIFFKGLSSYLCGRLYFIATGLNQK